MAGDIALFRSGDPLFDYDAEHKPLNYAFDDRHVLNFKIQTTDDSSKIESCTLDGHNITMVGVEYFMQLLINKAGMNGCHMHGTIDELSYDFTFPLTATDYTLANYLSDIGESFLYLPIIAYCKEVKQKILKNISETTDEYLELISEYGAFVFDHFREILSSPFTSITGDAYAIRAEYDTIASKIDITAFPANAITSIYLIPIGMF